jgi:hypothetical protein
MKSITEQTHLDCKIALHDHTSQPLTVKATVLSLTHQGEQLTDCHLTFQVDSETYQYVETQSLFRLLPGIRGNFPEQMFAPDLAISIETKLRPKLLSLLDQYYEPEEAASYLVNLWQQGSDSPLQSTESWLGLQVTQRQTDSKIGYRTFWASASESAIADETVASGQLFEEMETFFAQEWTDALPDDFVEAAVSELVEEVNQVIEAWVDESTAAFSETATSELVAELTEELEVWANHELQNNAQTYATTQPIFQAVLNFFQEDDWSFTKIKSQPTLRMAFKGKSGQWTCYAKAREEQQQFIFYSLCPIAIPKPKRNKIAEFLTRANYGMTIGNFELDYTDGEIRYKTSIDVTGDRLTAALIQRLVYINVTMMDEYLPGIQAVLAGQTPEAALQSIESATAPQTPTPECLTDLSKTAWDQV